MDNMGKLTNLDIATHYKDIKVIIFPTNFLAAFSYWTVAQNPNIDLIDTLPALRAFEEHVLTFFTDRNKPKEFSCDRLSKVVNDKIFENIPEILELNKLKPDFICLGALARNVYYMVLREYITSR